MSLTGFNRYRRNLAAQAAADAAAAAAAQAAAEPPHKPEPEAAAPASLQVDDAVPLPEAKPKSKRKE